MLEIQGTNSLGQRTGFVFVAVLIGHLFLISAQVQSKSGVSLLESATFGVFSRVQGAVASVVGSVRDLWGNVGGLRRAREENVALRAELDELQVQLHQQQALAARTAELQTLLDLKTSTALPTVAAEIIAGNPNPGLLTITIDRGTADGVQADMAVIAPEGVVGRILGEPATHAARVQLAIDRTAAAGARIARTRVAGMAVGVNGDPPLALQLISNLADVVAGDAIVTSGVDGIYPPGFPIGTVERSERGQGLYRTVTVRPAVDFARLESVLVVLVPARGAQPDPSDAAAPVEPAK
jgi:rod shape-determining protein MreC